MIILLYATENTIPGNISWILSHCYYYYYDCYFHYFSPLVEIHLIYFDFDFRYYYYLNYLLYFRSEEHTSELQSR